MNLKTAVDFITESNLIEGITRTPTMPEVGAHRDFMRYSSITIPCLQNFVNVCQPGAVLRDQPNMNVRIGSHIPQRGGAVVVAQLDKLLSGLGTFSPYQAHCLYENLHPFTDCNGRSGRVLWAWMMAKYQRTYPKTFLRIFYYQALDQSREKL